MGIGSNCNGKTSIKFKIEPQQIKKAAVKLIRGKDGAPNTIALTYNKKTLQEYADYIITEYGEMKNKKIPVTIEGRSDFTGNVTKVVYSVRYGFCFCNHSSPCLALDGILLCSFTAFRNWQTLSATLPSSLSHPTMNGI